MFNYDISQQERVTLHCLITLLSPLSHIGEVSGNVSNLKTLKLLDFEGVPRSCFIYSGNALRNGILRRRGISAALKELELKTSREVHRTLFAGGRLDGTTQVDMDLDRKIRQLMPWLSVLGTAKPVNVFGSKNTQMIPGRINVGNGYLICYESAPYVFELFPGAYPPEVQASLMAVTKARRKLLDDPLTIAPTEAAESYKQVLAEHLPYLKKTLRTWTEHLIIDQSTRRDSLQDPELRGFLTDEVQETEDKSMQMIMQDRLIMPGSRLYSRWDLHTTTVETGWIVKTLLEFAQAPHLGGKNGRHNNLCKIDIWYQKQDDRGHFLSVSAGQNLLSEFASDRLSAYHVYLESYRQFLLEVKNSTEIQGLLNG